MHVAVADGGQRLDAEKEGASVTRRIEVCDRTRYRVIERRKKQVEGDENGRKATEQARPSDRHAQMVEVLPYPARQAVDQYFDIG